MGRSVICANGAIAGLRYSEAMASIKQKMARGAAWMMLASFSNRAVGLVSTLVLARLLVPADFGLVAMAISVIAIMELLTAFSFDSALVSNHSAPPEHYHTAWTLNIIFTACGTVVLMALAWPASVFYNDPRLFPVLAVIGGSLLFQAFENIGVVAFRKEMTFGREFTFMMGKRLAAVLVTIPTALLTHSYWALVVGMVAGRLTGVVLSYGMHPFRPHLSLQGWRELLRFSRWLLINNVLNLLNTRSTDFIIGKTGGATALGLYSLSYEISTLPTSEIVAPINRAVLPGYAQLSRERSELQRGYLDVMGAIALLALPASFGLAAVAELAVFVLLGPKWAATVPLVSVLAFYGALTALDSNSYPAYLVLGRPSIASGLAATRVAILLPALIVLTSQFGALGAAWSMLAVGCVLTPAGLLILFHLLQIRLRSFLAILWRPATSALSMFLVVRELMPPDVATLSWRVSVVHLVALIAAGAVTYLGVLLLLWRLSGGRGQLEQLIVDRLRLLLPWRRRAA